MKGGEFLIKAGEHSFSPDSFTEEQKMIAATVSEFVETIVWPVSDKIEIQESGLTPSLLEKAGELGLLGTAIPEEFGGFGKDFITNMLLTECMGPAGSFAVSVAAHTGIGTLPILYFGNEDQKKKYLPKLATGEWKAAYCLTEPGSGSDALAAKTKALPSADGKSWVLNGQKMWITNAGFADVFIVFAQANGDQFTGFIVERNTTGLSFGEEEHKMGIKGSSTRQVFFTDCNIPAENLLGTIGKGHLIAFNILNIGRAKLAAAALGASKRISSLSIQYAMERQQFNLPLVKFGAIRHKIAEQAIRIWALETAVYRVSGWIDEKEKELANSGKEFAASLLGAAEEYATECAILKIFGSEVLNFVVDEGVQIYGGMGYSADAPMERAYRDSRINRIFEGTNEINRMLIVDMLLKRAMKGALDLLGPASKIQEELLGIPELTSPSGEAFEAETILIDGMKKTTLMIAGTAVKKYMMNLAKEQEILMDIADLVIETFVCESMLVRVKQKINSNPEPTVDCSTEMLQTYLFDASERTGVSARRAIASMCDGDEARILGMGLKRFLKYHPVNTKDNRRKIAEFLNKNGKYPF